MKNLLTVAINEIGVKEIKGSKHNERILEYAKESHFSWVKDDETAWCSIFLNWVAKQAGLVTSKSAAARSWLNVGFEVQNPEPGDVVVFWRKSLSSHFGHVGIYLGYSSDGSRVYVLGGNQGDSVSISGYGADRILGFRRLTSASSTSLPPSPLRKGSKGANVVKIQDALKTLGFNPGTSDGDFGPRTKAALEQLQATSLDLSVTGIYNAETKKFMEELLADKN